MPEATEISAVVSKPQQPAILIRMPLALRDRINACAKAEGKRQHDFCVEAPECWYDASDDMRKSEAKS